MKQTAVEWLMEIDKSRAITIEEWQQAKEIEKEQMVDFVIKWMGEDDLKDDIIKHYNETFNTNG
jgi:hypothetical protein